MEPKRAKKATVVQREFLVEALFQDKSLAREKFETIQGKRLQQEKWEELSQQLNALGGATKKREEWKRYWRDLLFRTKTRARSLRSAGSGINGPAEKPLTAEEEKIVSIISAEQIYGNQEVGEIGVGSNTLSTMERENPSVDVAVIITENPAEEPVTEIDQCLLFSFLYLSVFLLYSRLQGDVPTPITSTSRTQRRVRTGERRSTRLNLLDLSRKNMEATEKSTAEIIKLKQEKNQLLKEQVSATKELVAEIAKLNSVAERLLQAYLDEIVIKIYILRLRK